MGSWPTLGALFVLQLVKELAGWGGVALAVIAALAFALVVAAQRRPAFHTAMLVLALATGAVRRDLPRQLAGVRRAAVLVGRRGRTGPDRAQPGRW